MKKILAISPHTDDIELGCGATLHKYHNDYEIDALAISNAQPLATGDPVQEFYNAMEVIRANASFWNFEPRTISIHRQELLDRLWELQQERKYDIIFCPSSYDNHQDHQYHQLLI